MICCSMRGAGVVTWAVASVGATITEAGDLCSALCGHYPVGCGELGGGRFGVEVSHGLLLAKVCGAGIPKSPIPPAWNVK